jgi:hypothetical protein
MKIEKPYCRIKNKQRWDIKPDHPMYCCQGWQDNYVDHPAVPVSYHPSFRYYYLISDSRVPWIQRINRCIVCDHKFPKYLADEWVEIQEKEYGIKNPFSSKDTPEEFKSEEWWRKRGL